MSSTTKNTSTYAKWFAEHHNINLKRDIPLTGEDAALNTKKDDATVLTAFRDFFKAHHTLKRDIPLTGEDAALNTKKDAALNTKKDAALNTKKDAATVLTAFRDIFKAHHTLKRDIPLTGEDAALNTKKDAALNTKKDDATVLTAFRDFFKVHHRVMVKRGIIATLPGDGTFVENGATKHKESGVVVVETSEKIQGA